MPYNGSGTFTRSMDWEADAASGIKIRADRHDIEMDDYASGLSTALTKDGQTQPVADIPMNGKKLINLAAPVNPQDAATKLYVDNKRTFTSGADITGPILFKDGVTTRGAITPTIGTGNPAKMEIDIRDNAGVVKNSWVIDDNGATLLNGTIKADDWVFPNNSATFEGGIDIGPTIQYVTWLGTGDGTVPLFNLRDARATTGAAGNAILAINKQASGTAALLLGNDGNGAALIGSNNVTLRFGKWVTGVFTEYMNMSNAGAFTLTGDLVIDATAVKGIRMLPVDAGSGRLYMESGGAAPQTWSISAWETGLQFASAGVYGTSTGTLRLRMHDDGTVDAANILRGRYAVQITRDGIGQETRGQLGVSPAGTVYVQKVGIDGVTIESGYNLVTNIFQVMPAIGATNCHLQLFDGQATPVKRVTVYWDSGYGCLMYSWNTAGAQIGYIGIKSDGRGVIDHTSGSEQELIDTGNLALLTYAGGTATNTSFPIGTTICLFSTVSISIAQSVTPAIDTVNNWRFVISGQPGSGSALAGTWRSRGRSDGEMGYFQVQRIA
jgi:hypothetical protein